MSHTCCRCSVVKTRKRTNPTRRLLMFIHSSLPLTVLPGRVLMKIKKYTARLAHSKHLIITIWQEKCPLKPHCKPCACEAGSVVEQRPEVFTAQEEAVPLCPSDALTAEQLNTRTEGSCLWTYVSERLRNEMTSQNPKKKSSL
ncbi:hypothetical protein HJG60_009935 [Phyllostomus discolor]|uniref:Uncharacterized protein n=1 Tax=Phyllostomus discolor TaxID=89673 RepID=A0A834BAF4_9CHIR|nr:hypothetical protein HJG60_009935 [Phyllostomus discolor]